jgi:hypothetical protein
LAGIAFRNISKIYLFAGVGVVVIGIIIDPCLEVITGGIIPIVIRFPHIKRVLPPPGNAGEDRAGIVGIMRTSRSAVSRVQCNHSDVI